MVYALIPRTLTNNLTPEKLESLSSSPIFIGPEGKYSVCLLTQVLRRLARLMRHARIILDDSVLLGESTFRKP